MIGEGELLDSVIVIDHLNGVAAATAHLSRTDREMAISAVTRAEVLSGVGDDGRGAVIALLDTFRLIPLDRPIADVAAEYRRRDRLRLPDAFQIAAAEVHGLRLATRDTRDLSPARYALVTVPYELDAK